MNNLFRAVARFFKDFWSPAYERSLLYLIPTAVVAVLIMFYLYQTFEEKEITPCSPGAYPGRCYHASSEACAVIWKNSEPDCRTVIHKLSLPPTKLTQPILTRCQELNVDRMLSASRVSSPECDQRHQELIEWQKRNPDFL